MPSNAFAVEIGEVVGNAALLPTLLSMIEKMISHPPLSIESKQRCMTLYLYTLRELYEFLVKCRVDKALAVIHLYPSNPNNGV
jgi:hypothetical protein